MTLTRTLVGIGRFSLDLLQLVLFCSIWFKYMSTRGNDNTTRANIDKRYVLFAWQDGESACKVQDQVHFADDDPQHLRPS